MWRNTANLWCQACDSAILVQGDVCVESPNRGCSAFAKMRIAESQAWHQKGCSVGSGLLVGSRASQRFDRRSKSICFLIIRSHLQIAFDFIGGLPPIALLLVKPRQLEVG